jgi:hypothetical protein
LFIRFPPFLKIPAKSGLGTVPLPLTHGAAKRIYHVADALPAIVLVGIEKVFIGIDCVQAPEAFGRDIGHDDIGSAPESLLPAQGINGA